MYLVNGLKTEPLPLTHLFCEHQAAAQNWAEALKM